MRKLHSLQALRGIAVLAVLLFHIIAVELKYSAGATLLAHEALWLQLGVDLFFVISGFVMVLVTRSRFQQPKELGRFLFHRIARIYPNYWIYFLLTLLVLLLQPHLVNSSHGSSNIWLSFFLVPNDKVQLVMVAWSLIFELWFYLVFSAFLLCREKWLPTLLASWALGLIIFNLSADLEAFSPLMKIVLHPYALEFILGSVAGLLFFSRHADHIPLRPVFLLAVLAMIALPWSFSAQVSGAQGVVRMLLCGGSFATLLLALALLEQRQYWTPPTVLSAIGDMSYTVYLSHILVLGVIGKAWQWYGPDSSTLLDNAVFVSLMFGAALSYGWLAYKSLEKPLVDLLNQYGNRWFRQPQPTLIDSTRANGNQ
jgi:exopolysaccharide production protein ExoZ